MDHVITDTAVLRQLLLNKHLNISLVDVNIYFTFFCAIDLHFTQN